MPEEYSAKVNSLIEDLVGPEHSPSSPNNFDRVMREDVEYAASVADYAANPDKLANDRAPSIAIQKETPQHRMCIQYKAMGMSNNDIAREMGLSVSWVCQILNQPWAKARLVKMLTEAGKDPLKALIESAAIDSIHKMIELRDAKSTPPAVAGNMADKLLDRFLGKPTQHIESKTEVTNVPKEIAEVEAELKRLELEEKRLGINVISKN
jgi:hypothetical protein